jgi:hypothetical protein
MIMSILQAQNIEFATQFNLVAYKSEFSFPPSPFLSVSILTISF